jgi:hypothetical protein
MKNLVELLKSETESLKVQYLEMTREWAIKEFNHLREWAVNYHSGKFGFKNGENARKYYRLPYYIVNSNGVVGDHVAKMIKNATNHYESSIEKLAIRIEKKGLNQESLSIVTSHIGVNINTTLTDGIKTVRAFTIIASGEVQRPHYRYLIK